MYVILVIKCKVNVLHDIINNLYFIDFVSYYMYIYNKYYRPRMGCWNTNLPTSYVFIFICFIDSASGYSET